MREAEWLDGWKHNMIYSESGLVEEGAVFSTPLQKQNICNIKQVIFGVLVAFMILFIYVY